MKLGVGIFTEKCWKYKCLLAPDYKNFLVLFLRFDTAGGRRDATGYWVIFLSISSTGQFSMAHNIQTAQLAPPRLKFQKHFASLHAVATAGCTVGTDRRAGSLTLTLESAGTSHCSGFTFNAWNCQQVELLCPKINLFKRGTCLGLIFFFPSRQGEQGNWKRWDRTVYFQKWQVKKILFV